jgi:Tol biopolymer transport system component
MSPQQTIAHYRVTAKLGEGGMGEVWRATDTKLGRDVALKILPASFAQDPDRLARFEREAMVLAALNHPNIAMIHGVEENALVMELVPGPTLAEMIASGPIPLEEALGIAAQIAEALEAAHEKGVIHRDLKPANVKVTPEGVVKVLDFGLAKEADPAPQAEARAAVSPTLTMRATQLGVILGTAGYMAPEQAAGKPVDRRADIWSFGVVLYELLTGKMLFSGETVSHTLASVLKDPIDLDLPQAPAPIRRLLARCLNRNAKERLRDIGEARIAIRGYLANPAAEAPQAAPPVAARRLQWLPWMVATLAVVAAAAVAGREWLRPQAVEIGAVRFPVILPDGTSEAPFLNAAQAAPSPDGRLIAFSALDKSSGKENLWVRPLASVAARKLDRTEGANFPFWSPDGQFIGFFADDKLKRVAVSGGSPQTLCDAPGTRILSFTTGDGGAWNRDGVIVFAGSRTPLMRVAASGGTATAVTALEKGEEGHSWPQFLPDGRHLLYLAVGTDATKSGLYVRELGSSKRTLILKTPVRAAWSPPGYLLFVREASLYAQRMNPNSFQLEGEPALVAEEVSNNEGNGRAAFAVSESGVLVHRGRLFLLAQQLAWYDREGKRLRTIGTPGAYWTVALSPDEKSAMLVVGRSGSADTWIMDLATGVLNRLTLDSQSSYSVAGPWSPDSQRVAVNRAFRGGVNELTVASGKSKRLVPDSLFANDWSPDGNSLLCTDDSSHRLSLLPLAGDSTPRTVLDTPYRKQDFRFAPGGQWVAYSSEESGRLEVFVASFPSFTEKRQISSGGGSTPFWRKDGRELFYVAADRRLMSAEIKAGPRIEGSVPKALFQLPRRDYAVGTAMAATGDGKRFLVLEGGQQDQQPQIMVVLNWAAGLRK